LPDEELVKVFLEDIEMTFMEPCVAGPGYVRMFAEMSRDVSELLPYLNAVIKTATYNKEADTLCFTRQGKLIALYPEKIAVAKAHSPTDAWEMLDWIKDTINETYENQDTIQPNYQRRAGVTALDIFQFLPRLNCRKCDELTCLAFAVNLLAGKREIAECKPLFEDKNSRLKKVLLELVSALGYKIPESHEAIQEQL
jgi:ArsR family metal-binding transcriptional regulator